MPAPIRRALEARDSGCRFPGCGLRHCDAHHVRHWAEGGGTRLDNLVLLCRRHHRLVHEESWKVQVGSDGDIRFFRSDGRQFMAAPPLPPIAEDLGAELTTAHGRAGLLIDPETSERFRSNQPLDLDFTMLTLR